MLKDYILVTGRTQITEVLEVLEGLWTFYFLYNRKPLVVFHLFACLVKEKQDWLCLANVQRINCKGQDGSSKISYKPFVVIQACAHGIAVDMEQCRYTQDIRRFQNIWKHRGSISLFLLHIFQVSCCIYDFKLRSFSPEDFSRGWRKLFPDEGNLSLAWILPQAPTLSSCHRWSNP